MKITVIGASGLIGTKARRPADRGGPRGRRRVPQPGVDVLTGEGLADALAGADVLVDVVNSPSFEDEPGDGLFHHVDHQPGGRRRGRRCRPLRRSVDRRARRPARQRLPAGQGRSGEAHHRIRSAVHDRARHPVRRVRRCDHRVDDRRRRGACARRVDPADRRRPRWPPRSPAPRSPSRSTAS